MADNAEPSPSLATWQSEYQVRISLFVATLANTWERMLLTDSRRWAVRFRPTGALPFVQWYLPGQPPAGTVPTGATGTPEEYHRRDWPGAVPGEWYYFGGVGDSIVIIEDLYIGG